jgi:hypothetical protein
VALASGADRELGAHGEHLRGCLHDCEAYMDAKLRSLVALDYATDKMEILVYSDASSDGTDAIVSRWAHRTRAYGSCGAMFGWGSPRDSTACASEPPARSS